MRRISVTLLEVTTHPWAAAALSAAAVVALLIALGMPATEAIRVAGPINSGTGGS